MNNPIDLTLLDNTRLQLKELLPIVQEKVYAKNIVLEKINAADRNLGHLNTIQRGTIKAYKKERADWKAKGDYEISQFGGTFSELAADADRMVAEALEADHMIKAGKKPKPITMPKLFDAEKADRHWQALSVNSDLITGLLAQDLHIRFARKRKIIWWIVRQYFRFFVFFTTAFTIAISFIVGALVELMADYFFESVPKLITGTFVAVICGFTINKPIEKRAGAAFWKNAGKQVLRMVKQLEMLKRQFADIQQFRQNFK